MALEETFLQSFFHLRLAFQIGLAFVVYLVEADAQCLVSLVETGVHPRVHLLPQCAHLGIALFPLHQHGVCLLDERSLGLGFLLSLLVGHAFGNELRLQLFHFLAIMLVEGHVVVADEMVALLSARFGRLAVAVFQPCEHRLADVYAAVVHDVGLHHAVAVGLHDLRQAPSQQVVAHMTEVEGLVRVGRRVFYHHQRALVGGFPRAESRIGVDVGQQLHEGFLGDDQVEEAAHGIVAVDDIRLFHHPLPHFGSCQVGFLL